ncbi:hypothetical protein Gpo141_00009526 [Globisporangium polare]
MGAGASVAAVIDEECQRPLDASDVDSPRGISAKNEVMRLRLLLATQANQLGDLLTEDQPQYEYQDSGQQTDKSLLSDAQEADDQAAAETMALAPGIEEYLIACFTNADLDSSGVLSRSEFSRLLREHVDLGLSPEDIQLLLGQAQWMDAKGDVTWQQFVHLAPQLLANLVDTSSQAPSTTDWCACISTEGTAYYYNKRTQESSWDKPLTEEDDLQQQQLVDESEGGPTAYDAFTTVELQVVDCEQQADNDAGAEHVGIL